MPGIGSQNSFLNFSSLNFVSFAEVVMLMQHIKKSGLKSLPKIITAVALSGWTNLFAQKDV